MTATGAVQELHHVIFRVDRWSAMLVSAVPSNGKSPVNREARTSLIGCSSKTIGDRLFARAGAPRIIVSSATIPATPSNTHARQAGPQWPPTPPNGASDQSHSPRDEEHSGCDSAAVRTIWTRLKPQPSYSKP